MRTVSFTRRPATKKCRCSSTSICASASPLAYASAAERMLAAIGEPEVVDTRNDPRLSRLFSNRMIRRYPAFREFYGMEEAIAADRRLLQPRRAGARGAQAGALPARSGGRRQVVDRRAAEAADGGASDLRAEGLAGERVAARPVPSGARRRRCSRTSTASRSATSPASCQPWAIKRLQEFDGDITQVPGRAHPALGAAPGRDRQDRAGRREQPGHLVAGRQGRHPQARVAVAGRSRRLQLLGRPVPGEPGAARVRRDVQGADQDAASAADRDAGRQLQGHRRLLGDPVPGR